MNKVLVFGHKNPDTDSIASAITYAYLKQQIGVDAEAVRLGSISEETAFALETFGFESPRQIDRAASESSKVILVDHNEKQQSVDDIEDVQVLEVIDHHRIANFQTSEPLYYRAEPVGCTATILNKLFKEHGVTIPKNIAGLMLSAIISDSLLFKSPTFTEEDRKAADELTEIAGVDANVYGLDMLKAGANLSDKTLEELISLDAKTFEVNDVTMEIAQVNAVDLNDVLNRKDELTELLTKVVSVKKLDLFLFVITDIINNDSIAIAIGEKAFSAMAAFKVVPANDMAILNGIVSRKKQIVPVLTEAFK
ncbi:manganese-dependent inorganic pyrophosphatase [Sporosarcina sp. BI001-red]|uniref:manganese-dependent inorganic pyrophosphatase n=1 Tax=Sporosarcina sp. BI001-red TaxID=2282866 RepID=UPI000E25E4D7|nr:manganese-dependent inorganic pyrophosphatase [Sporosarcina sp. BI001-red]REB07805.1 manganese-dependent inorganic pyrophosphatase [Sporosarcina sp. BI001-red]